MDIQRTEDADGSVTYECADGVSFTWHKSSNTGWMSDKYGRVVKNLGFTGENGVRNAACRHECNVLIGRTSYR